MKTTEHLYEELDKLPHTLGITQKGPLNGLSVDDKKRPKKKHGGQPGNQNARKHGFYSRYLSPEQAKQLEEAGGFRDLRPEIALLRVKLNDLLEDPDTSPELTLKTVNALTRLLSVQRRYVWQ